MWVADTEDSAMTHSCFSEFSPSCRFCGVFGIFDATGKSRQGCHPERMRRISSVRRSLAEKRFFTLSRMTMWRFLSRLPTFAGGVIFGSLVWQRASQSGSAKPLLRQSRTLQF